MPRHFRLPSIAANTAEAIVEEWAVDTGCSFRAGEVLLTVETDKALVEIAADADGVLARQLAGPGETVQVGAPIAVVTEEGEVLGDGEVVINDEPVDANAHAAQEAVTASLNDAPPAAQTAPERVFISPLARRLAAESALPTDELTGTGPRGRILRADVERALEVRAKSHDPHSADTRPSGVSERSVSAGERSGEFEDIPHTRIRRAIATRLTQSKRDAPHFYLRAGIRADRLVDMHSRMRAHDQQLSVTDLIVKAVARAHARVPAMNVIWQEDSVRRFSSVDVAVAVAIEGGLVTPVIRDVDRRTVGSVSAELRDLAARARNRRLHHDELAGGSITVSSLGMFGVEEFAAVINPPQSAILAVGQVRAEPVVENGAVVPGKVLRVTLSVDHRSVDGVVAAEWMRCLSELIEDPALFLS
jgi:pyruvate dehydrogenase E2 component (dihydrolipoamide acetyltransferase)